MGERELGEGGRVNREEREFWRAVEVCADDWR